MAIFLGPGNGDGDPQDPDLPGEIQQFFPSRYQPLEYFKISWISPAGRETNFSSLGQTLADFITTPGVSGFDMPTFTPYVDTSPGFDGEINRGFRTEPRDVSVPVYVYANDRDTYRKMRNDLFVDMNPRDGVPGQLVVTEMDGTTRTLMCFYAGGLEGGLDDVSQGQTWMNPTIEFHAPDPYWLGEVIAPTPSTNPDPGLKRTWFPFLPIRLAVSHVLGHTTITNTGQADSYPVFSITGPCSSINLTNQTSGQSITINRSFSGSDTLLIDCTPGSKTVLLNGTTNLYPYLDLSTNNKSLWALKPGVNQVNLDFPGLTQATSLSFTYRERFLAAW